MRNSLKLLDVRAEAVRASAGSNSSTASWSYTAGLGNGAEMLKFFTPTAKMFCKTIFPV